MHNSFQKNPLNSSYFFQQFFLLHNCLKLFRSYLYGWASLQCSIHPLGVQSRILFTSLNTIFSESQTKSLDQGSSPKAINDRPWHLNCNRKNRKPKRESMLGIARTTHLTWGAQYGLLQTERRQTSFTTAHQRSNPVYGQRI